MTTEAAPASPGGDGTPESSAPEGMEATSPVDPRLMSPAERQAAFDASVITDLSQLDPEFLAAIRKRGRQLMEDHGLIPPAE